ncbi:hypothetical protein INT47_012080 [Mucor saturninus]|uniref:Uncharacterized protein n=1 Tax=Mucor saturninus TaxID=64648 RepID=A0A8H7QLF1_9FUNG|nr:hypothetical protein INT47_012080 [Mucor saturninus]
MASNTPAVNIPDTDDEQRIGFHQVDIEDKVNKTDEFSSIFVEAELQHRNCQSVTESNALGEFLKRALEDHREFVKNSRSIDN